MTTKEYATALAEFLGGTQYGQMGLDPAPPTHLDESTLSYVRRLVCDGRRAALAQRNGDSNAVSWHRETVTKLRGHMRALGISADDIFAIGYRAAEYSNAGAGRGH